jgi:hypothetical protein
MESVVNVKMPDPPDRDQELAGLHGEWLTTEQLADILKRDASTLRRWRTSRPPQGPPFVRMTGRVTLYSAGDVQLWLLRRRVDPEAAA